MSVIITIMVPPGMNDFLVACLGASASFIGLLFVALSVVLQKTDKEIAATDRILAESSYASLINIFFICLVAILPHESIGYVVLTMSVLGLISCARLRRYSRVFSLVISTIIYLIELFFALNILKHPHEYFSIGLFQGLIISLFAISLGRAWGLTGINAIDSKKK